MKKLLRYTGKDIQDISLDFWLMQKPAELHTLARKWLEVIERSGPDVKVIFHDNYPIGCVEEAPFAYVNVYTVHVNACFFYGTSLADDASLLEGSGKQMRHVKLLPGQTEKDEALEQLIRAAYVDIKQRLKEEP